MSTFDQFMPYLNLALSLLLLIWLISQELRLRRFFAGKNARNLEDTLQALLRHVGKLEDGLSKENARGADHERRLASAVRFVRTERFNPFAGSGEGGNQSFVTVFLDEEGNGVVLSTLYTRERTSVYGKPLRAYGSPFPLTKEEQALVEAIHHERT